MNCTKCGKEVFEAASGLVHTEGGMYGQLCKNCGWSGGQADGYSQCPRCGDATSLVNDHKATTN